MTRVAIQHLTLATALALTACGGGSGSDPFAGGGIGGSSSGTETAEGGIGGSGAGTATGFGSIYINDNRYFQVDNDASVTLDGQPVAASTVNDVNLGLPVGVTVEYILGEDADDGLSSGTATVLSAWHQVIGPVTATSPLAVLGQPVQATNDTHIDVDSGSSLADLDSLTEGDLVLVAGNADAANVIRASRIAQPLAAPAQWQLSGRVSDYDDGAGSFRIGNQDIVLNGVMPTDCDSFGDGRLVRVIASADGGFSSGSTLDTVTSVTCIRPGFNVLGEDAPETLPVAYEGIILDVSALPQISVGGRMVNVANVLDLVFGRFTDLSVGTHVEVEGTLDTGSGVIEARRIIFLDPLVELTGPVSAALAGESLSVLGLTVRGTIGMSDDDLVFANGESDIQVSVSGFSDDNLVVYAQQVTRQSATADSSDVSLYGAITAVSANTISILGTEFDIDSASGISIITLDNTEQVIDLNNGSLCVIDLALCPDTSNELIQLADTDNTALLQGAYNGISGAIDGTLRLYTD